MLVQIGTTDISDKIVEGTYKMDQKDIGHKWTDGFGNNHVDVYKTRISGSFDLYFASNKGNTMSNFLRLVDDNTSLGILKLKVYVTNKNVMKEIDAHYEINSKKHADVSKEVQFDKVTVEIEEV